MSERRATGPPILGVCPNCTATIPERGLVVRYEADGEWPRLLAVCPDCDLAVSPR